MRAMRVLTPNVRLTRRDDGFILDSLTPLPPPARCVGEWLIRWAKQTPSETFLAERDERGAWRRLTYAEALTRTESLASLLLEKGATPDRPVMLLNDNGIDHALVSLAAMHIGVPIAPVSPAYSLMSKSFGRLKYIANLIHPRFVFTGDPQPFAAALSAIGDAELLDASTTHPRSHKLDAAFNAVTPNTGAKVLFTSGSTGEPKGVVTTQRMLTSNQESLAAIWPFLSERAPVVVDWLPWSHTFGANHNFFLVLRSGGSLYIDRGRPAPGAIDTTVKNMAEVRPTLWFNVPRGFDQALTVLEKDDAAAKQVFSRLELLFYAAAALAPSTRERLEKLAKRHGNEDLFFTSSWGSTETAPLSTSAHFPTRTTGILGVPVPGVSLKLERNQDKLELKVKGPNVTPGYWQRGGGVTPAPLDAEGYLPTGDAGRLADEAHPEQGVVFVGRLSENFKVSSGTWVNVAAVRLAVVEACAPFVLDAVIAGDNRDQLGALLFPSPAAQNVSPEELTARLEKHNQAHPGGSERIGAALLMTQPLSLDAGETTDKGYTNQRRVLQTRAAEADRLFTTDPAVLRPR
ncbi:MAG: AMP-binding protein [Myxococcaceae bacterium]